LVWNKRKLIKIIKYSIIEKFEDDKEPINYKYIYSLLTKLKHIILFFITINILYKYIIYLYIYIICPIFKLLIQ
jgi:hypothetical protein